MTTSTARTWAVAAISIALYMTVIFIAAVVATHPEQASAWARDYAGLVLGIVAASLWSAYIGGVIARAQARATPKTPVTTHIYRWEAGRITGIVGDEPEIDPTAKAALEVLLNGVGEDPAEQADSAALIKAMAAAADACVGAIANSDPTIIRAYAGDALMMLTNALPVDVVPPGCDPDRLPVVRLTRAIQSALAEIDGSWRRQETPRNDGFVLAMVAGILTRAIEKQQTRPAAAEPSPAPVGGAGG